MLVGNCSFERECSAISATTSARVWVFSYVPSMGFCLFPGFSKIIQICSQYVIVKVKFYDLNSQPHNSECPPITTRSNDKDYFLLGIWVTIFQSEIDSYLSLTLNKSCP